MYTFCIVRNGIVYKKYTSPKQVWSFICLIYKKYTPNNPLGKRVELVYTFSIQKVYLCGIWFCKGFNLILLLLFKFFSHQQILYNTSKADNGPKAGTPCIDGEQCLLCHKECYDKSKNGLKAIPTCNNLICITSRIFSFSFTCINDNRPSAVSIFCCAVYNNLTYFYLYMVTESAHTYQPWDCFPYSTSCIVTVCT